MTVNAILVSEDGTPIHFEEAWRPTSKVLGNEVLLATITGAQAHGTFTSANRSTAGTTILTSPNTNGSLILTDLIIGTDKVNNATVTVQVTDGSQTEPIFATNVTDAPANVAISFAGRWQGWKDARVELVTTNTVDATVSLGYVKAPIGLDYVEWDARR